MNPMRILGGIVDAFRHRHQLQEKEALLELKARYHAFRIFLENNGRALELIVAIDALLNRGEETDIRATTEELLMVSGELVDGLNLLSGERYAGLYALHGQLANAVAGYLNDLDISLDLQDYCVTLDELDPGAVYSTGAKAANLARLRRMGLPVPNGFVCTTKAFKTFLHKGQLAADIRRLLAQVEAARQDIYAVAAEIGEMIVAAPLPEEISGALATAYDQLERTERGSQNDKGRLAVSVRSSGVAEDGADHSFAGQFTSVLNVSGTQALEQAYKEVVASSFSARSISYRQNAGLPLVDFHFAVLCQVMAEAQCAGVLFTSDPSQPDSGRMVISAVPGLGTTAVGGSTTTDLYRPRRKQGKGRPLPPAPPDTFEQLLEEAEISHKTMREVPSPQGGLQLEPVPEEEADLPLLQARTLEELVALGELIESLEGATQDIEWSYSPSQGISILQARPLRLAAKREADPAISLDQHPLLSGICAVSGRAIGRARLAHSAAELRELEASLASRERNSPSILVLPQSIVDAVPLMQNCVGIVIEVGNPTDHLSCIAREYGIPMITGAQSALSALTDGQWIVLDADRGKVFIPSQAMIDGMIEIFAKYRTREESARSELPAKSTRRGGMVSPERQTLRKMIVPLNLTDAYGATFSQKECRSIHDIVRYTHEMAVLAMFDTGDMIMEQAGGLLRPLDIGIPFSFLVIDVGGGVRRTTDSSWRKRLAIHRPLFREDILSFPLAALCDGLTTPGLSWHSGPDIDALPGIFSKALLDGRGARPAGSFNYALAARDYLNLNARVEFHFAMLDTVCGRDSHANYIRFRFKGGGAGIERGRRRADFLKYVFEKNSFYTSVAGDLITASLTGASKEIVTEKLIMIGRLLGFSRFLDGIMSTETTPLIMAKAFLAGNFAARENLAGELQEQVNSRSQA